MRGFAPTRSAASRSSRSQSRRLAPSCRKGAGATRHHRRRGVRRAQQRGEQRRLFAIETARVLVEEPARGSGHALQLAAPRDEVEIGLEDFLLAPARFERERGARLAPLLRKAPAAGPRAQALVEHGRELHRDRARAAAPAAGEVVPGGAEERSPVDAAVLAEAAVLGRDHRRNERGRDAIERHPLEAPSRRIGTQLVERLAVPVEEHALGRAEARAHGGELGRGVCYRAEQRHAEKERSQRAHDRAILADATSRRGSRCASTTRSAVPISKIAAGCR